MRIRTETGAGHHSISLAGRFDAHEIDGFRVAFDPLLAEPAIIVRVDLANVVFVDSSALAELLRAQRAARESDGDLILVNMSDPVRIILELTALEKVFTTEAGANAGVGVAADGSGRPVETR
jgi:anti-sigma B factor antagonist